MSGAAAVRLLSMLLLWPVRFALARVSCDDDSICHVLLRPGSTCVMGYCSNPFRSGCLQNYLPDSGEFVQKKRRACNSDDSSADAISGVCAKSRLDYPEIRIASQNWESAMFTGWIFQIVLSELLDVPATIETSDPERNLNFYDLHNAFDYGSVGYDYGALETALDVGDCRILKTGSRGDGEEAYRPCAHFMPEVWNGQAGTWREVEERGIIEPPSGSGAVARLGWFIPRHLAEKDNTLLEYLGFQGEENREKVARTFQRPMTWGDYCAKVSPNNCAPDGGGAAMRPPADEAEAGRYFAPGLYTGHFRATEKNNCNANPAACTGHIVDIPCDWSTFALAQAHWLGIPVESDGPMEPNGGYSYSSLVEIYHAANATKSAVLMYWWTPEALYQDYLGTDYEMLNVQLTPPSQDCVLSRVTTEQRSSANFEDRVGEADGACDGEAHSLVKLIVRNLLEKTFEQEESVRSPGYDAVRSITLSELQIGRIMTYWSSRNIDKWNYDPREAVCRWVAENLDYLKVFIPRSYPRVVTERELGPVWKVTMAIACVATALTILTSIGVYHFREEPAIRYAQPPFLGMVLVGLLTGCIGTVVLSVADPSRASCTSGTWLVVVGYSLALVPLMVKVATINKVLSVSRSFRRIKVNCHQLYAQVMAVTGVVVIVLLAWTVVDPPKKMEDLKRTEDQTENNETIVELSTYCGSESPIWYFVAIGWQILLLLATAVLAFQNRSVRQEFNESGTLAFMIYSHLVFSILLFVTFLPGSYSPQLLSGFRYLLYGCDIVVTLFVYFAPKLLSVFDADKPLDPFATGTTRRPSLLRTSGTDGHRSGSLLVRDKSSSQYGVDTHQPRVRVVNCDSSDSPQSVEDEISC